MIHSMRPHTHTKKAKGNPHARINTAAFFAHGAPDQYECTFAEKQHVG